MCDIRFPNTYFRNTLYLYYEDKQAILQGSLSSSVSKQYWTYSNLLNLTNTPTKKRKTHTRATLNSRRLLPPNRADAIYESYLIWPARLSLGDTLALVH